MIVTFYSYKGGVGRSMALANTADLLARSGLRVLIIDFDLEAPGLEHFYPVDHDWVHGREGLLDLLLAYKYSMSAASSGYPQRDAFRQLDRFLTTIYPVRSGGGCLDLLSAGQRQTDDQLLRYGLELRQFDWLNFYFTWSGELFFEWLRKVLAERYDVVLVDSRTGVTEMGGICAYQLADVIVAFCAPNLQNIAGTETMIRHFLSPAVRAVRGDRPLDVLVVPARIEQGDSGLRQTFQQRFDERFAPYLPAALADAGLTLWDLQIPYEPRFAFDEQVVTDPDRIDDRRGLAAAYGRLLRGIALLAPDDSPLVRLGHVDASAERRRGMGPVETRYDPTTRFAAPDVFIWFGPGAAETAEELAAALNEDPGVTAMISAGSLTSRDLAQRAKVVIVLVSGGAHWGQEYEIPRFLELNRPVIPVLLAGADQNRLPPWLADAAVLDFSSGIDKQLLRLSVRRTLSRLSSRDWTASETERNPYPGLLPFREEDADVFFGREQVVAELVSELRRHGACFVVGPAGAGKTSAVFAGLIPALRGGALPGSERWPVVSFRPGGRPLSALAEAIAVVTGQAGTGNGLPDSPAELSALLRERHQHVLLVVDQMEELFTQATSSERDRFIHYLRQFRNEAEGSASVFRPVLVMRADFAGDVQAHPDLAGWFTDGATVIGPLDSNGLRRAVEAPVAASGVAFEPGLVDRLMADTADEPGALPLLQFVLQSLWATQRDGYLTHEAYETTGGVRQALAHRADQVLHGLSARDRDIARDLLLRLVTVTDEETRTRGPVGLSELASGPAANYPAGRAEKVIAHLTDGRLLVTSIKTDGTTSVELAHEALITAWPTFRKWTEDRRAALIARSRLNAAATEWQKLHRDPGALLTQSRLQQLLTAMGGDFPLSELERRYVQTSQAAHRRAASAQTGVAAVLSIMLIIIIILLVLAVH